MYWAPDGAPDFSHPNLELVPGDLRDRESLCRTLEGIEVVHNIAALYRPTNVPEQLYWEVNVQGMQNMVEEAAKAGGKRFIQCSTVGVHGTIENPPADEEGLAVSLFVIGMRYLLGLLGGTLLLVTLMTSRASRPSIAGRW
jgi:nucleoside-diphosphate-sugar epimerase